MRHVRPVFRADDSARRAALFGVMS